MIHVSCQGCGAWTIVQGGPCACDDDHSRFLGEAQMCSGQLHEALDATGTCKCCPEDHSHRLATIESGTPCRPIDITLMAGAAVTSVAGG